MSKSEPQIAAEISAAERWELIERILGSREFRRSTRLRELLHYLGDQSIHRGATSIREQEIGEAVFGRISDYDTSLDNIVRVNVTELRKRIGLFFENEGGSEALHMEIPRGTYIPVFTRAPMAEAEEAAEEISAASALPVEIPAELTEPLFAAPPSPTRYRLVAITSLSVAIVSLMVAIFFWREYADLRRLAYPWQSEPTMREFWGNFFQNTAEVDVVTADTSLGLAEDILQRSISLDDYLDYKYKDLTSLPGLSAETRQSLAQVLNRNLGSVGDFKVAASIIALEGRTHAAHLANARAFTPDNVKTNNVILIGGPGSNPWTSLYRDRLDFYSTFDPVTHRATFFNNTPQSGEPAKWELSGENDRGYSIVAFIPNLNPQHYALVIAGSDSLATQAAGEWLTSGEGLAWIRRKSPHGTFPYFEVLLASSHLEGTPLQCEVRAWRIHPR